MIGYKYLFPSNAVETGESQHPINKEKMVGKIANQYFCFFQFFNTVETAKAGISDA